jgi:hypothetical protein
MNRIMVFTSFLLAFSRAFCFAGILNITTENVEYLPYQPIYISAYYEGDQRVSLSPGAEDIVLHVKYNITGAETEFHSIERIDKLCSDCLKSKLAPAEIYKETNVLNITSDSRGWLFDKPGEYLVWISLTNGSAVSNSASIRVVPPKGADIAVAENIKKCHDFSMFVYMEGGDMFAEALATAEKIADGKSGYAECIRDLLVKNYSQQSCSIDGVKRLSDMTKVKKYYNSEMLAVRRHSKTRTLTLMGRLAGLTRNDYDVEFVKSEYRKLRSVKPSKDFDNYLHKKFVE